ncbi:MULTISPECIES: FAD-dependent 5-carboxymethylaminomethyl-2-thiouridine(34) oxidoreductase MnmC [Methylotenera]|uniref:FAD-dependent 5-carboxymethylaminomethyl-2-thiouridine(34) oxidoreductase MnmC n=1 Tax=Methylotenera TaxID=359407 RepID=UPI00036AD189|nr:MULTISPECIES: FAD-dependent 5-carboxymethylaminomethyl-2-thiouridine(34) oxidoreductase MnmC [Methylotenera]
MPTKTAIVIGGGIAGCSTAFALAKRGIAVTLLEQHSELAQEASGNPIATLYPKLSIKPTAQSTLALQGFAFTLNLLKQLPNNAAFFADCGQIQLAYNAREQLRQDALLAQQEYAFLQALDAKAASEVAGIPLAIGGLFLPQAGWVKPKALCQALVNLPNITKISNTHVLSFEKTDENFRIKYIKNNSQHTDIKSDILILCNANDVQRFSLCASVASTLVRGQVNFFAPTPASQLIKTIICSTHYLSPAVDGLHSIGATYAPNNLNSLLSEADTLENMQALKQISPAIFNSLQPYQEQGRVAWRSHTQDYMPLAGQLIDEKSLRAKPPRYNAKPVDFPWLNGLYINAGHGSKGMITAPICGELIANIITNESLSLDGNLVSKLNPSRFLLKELGLKQLANSLY